VITAHDRFLQKNGTEPPGKAEFNINFELRTKLRALNLKGSPCSEITDPARTRGEGGGLHDFE